MTVEVKMTHRVWTDLHPSRGGYVGRFQTSRGVHTVCSVLSKRVALIFPSEKDALAAAAAAICHHFDRHPPQPPAPTGKVKEFAVRKDGRRKRAVPIR